MKLTSQMPSSTFLMPTQAFVQEIHQDYERNGPLIKAAGIRIG